ncbi:cytochrome P450 [Suillus paluster]|uniref:cytochrome P450 n=1 Tax=Suillus paluster TaxID=48578 RepID=UPI001B869096|nr:cytochrome P450 [Suillus paluster]KAG1747258.1 cytochrome P450 [Suillus paluster]
MLTIPELLIFSTFLLLLSVSIRVWRQRRQRKGLPLPPGPKGLPILGNLLDINVSKPWLSYTDWAKKHGDIVYLSILGQEFIIISSEELAHTLMDQRSGVYSERPYVSTSSGWISPPDCYPMGTDGGNVSFGLTAMIRLLNYLVADRKMYHVGFSKEACREYQSMQLQKVHQFLENLIASPTQFSAHSKTLAVAIIMAITYGYDPAPAEDPFVTKVERFINIFFRALSPEGAALTGAIPFLQHIPSWLPGGMYKRRAGECRGLAHDILNDPVEYVKVEMAGGTTRHSLVRDLWGRYATKDNTVTVEDEETIKAVAATVFLGGAESTDSVLTMFLLVMVLHPEVQIKAQEEIDRVVGNSRLPDFSDRERLPYVEAVYLETLRWQPIIPKALPHATSTSDIYNGYYIPKGVNVVANIWAMTHDETRFPDPMSYKPERHLSPTGELLQGITSPYFGFGRRKCPGLYVADQSIWASIVSSLATLRIRKRKDSTGCEIDVKPEFTAGLALSIRPKPFAYSIEPRSANAERLIRASNRGE